jgi:hypothetical protein
MLDRRDSHSTRSAYLADSRRNQCVNPSRVRLVRTRALTRLIGPSGHTLCKSARGGCIMHHKITQPDGPRIGKRVRSLGGGSSSLGGLANGESGPLLQFGLRRQSLVRCYSGREVSRRATLRKRKWSSNHPRDIGNESNDCVVPSDPCCGAAVTELGVGFVGPWYCGRSFRGGWLLANRRSERFQTSEARSTSP